MSTYKITAKGKNAPEAFTVEADSHETAAILGVKKMHTENNFVKVTPVRVTGDHGKSGMFQGYKSCGENRQNSVGHQFHVVEL